MRNLFLGSILLLFFSSCLTVRKVDRFIANNREAGAEIFNKYYPPIILESEKVTEIKIDTFFKPGEVLRCPDIINYKDSIDEFKKPVKNTQGENIKVPIKTPGPTLKCPDIAEIKTEIKTDQKIIEQDQATQILYDAAKIKISKQEQTIKNLKTLIYVLSAVLFLIILFFIVRGFLKFKKII